MGLGIGLTLCLSHWIDGETARCHRLQIESFDPLAALLVPDFHPVNLWSGLGLIDHLFHFVGCADVHNLCKPGSGFGDDGEPHGVPSAATRA